MKKVYFTTPVKIDGKETNEVNMRAPKVRDMEMVGDIANDATRELTLVSNLTNITLDDLREMEYGAYTPLQEAVSNFLSPTQTV